MSEDTHQDKIEYHTKLIKDPKVRQSLFQQFAPTFCFHKSENNFPADPDDFIKNIIEVKRAEYIRIQQSGTHGLTDIEKAELQVIDKYFWENGSFNQNYKKYQNEAEFKYLTQKQPGQKEQPKFLIFDEKHYGYNLGEKIDIVGVAPKGHKKYNPAIPPAQLPASITPTKDGYFIQYDYVYPMNNAINGTQWLRKLLPESICKKVSDFGLHYGDCEGVGIHVKVDAEGQATFDSMQTYAHGSKGARNVPAKDCTMDANGKVCVFVGVGVHPSYADNFIGRNKFLDLVGDAYRIEPTRFVDVSKDVVDLAIAQTKPEYTPSESTKYIEDESKKLPPSLSAFSRIADSNPLSRSKINNAAVVEKLQHTHNRYKPFLFVEKTWNNPNNGLNVANLR
jgi:hypothetical protein